MRVEWIIIFNISLNSILCWGWSLKDNFIKPIFENQDKVCTMKYQDNEPDYEALFETITGFDLPYLFKDLGNKPYSGFKLQRVFTLNLFRLRFDKIFRVTYCDHGKAQWVYDQPLYEDIEWDSPICVYIPHAFEAAHKPKRKIWQKKKNEPLDKIYMKTHLKDIASEDLKNFHCFKLARRNKYTNRKYSLFFPGSWIGGLFYCDLEEDTKMEILDNMNNNLVPLNSLGFVDCDNSNSLPLLPIISDDYGKNWVEIQTKFVKTKLGRSPYLQFTKYIPYILTPNSPNGALNFKLSNIKGSKYLTNTWHKPFREQVSDMLQSGKNQENSEASWYNEIDVQEDYNIDPRDERLLSYLTKETITKFLELINFTNRTIKSFFVPITLTNVEFKDEKKEAQAFIKKFVNRVEIELWKNLSIIEKYITIISKYRNELKPVEQKWKNLTLSTEHFDYLLVDP
ncbi:hypothetical protein Kpol_1002p35 [Vanderwaltozyma polyspora DSM 70294]|uniref:Uncharacterized protein n=1 Tax=Vanderwaltozyma polyspora (strain ATCC 22028 / DSM 70294 / BCRC 21397 / CBS 2163 / NBRC 10782 / NRRL Y-8283 / UCD 57-17) TaxID=436907 RepID=A7TE66_VANPO|nr:uncharacterized protein Kpol_1002p35 [Vanderwaltozyma polyspora DSM 70294]EDO19388.1 hypothetical protein Kpol_1002p35 [Vanderwaltozyma polyspora DSM 70294]